MAEEFVGLAIRPYGTHLRSRVLEILEIVGVQVSVEDRLSGDIPDDEIVGQVSSRNVDLFLIPYHSIKDRNGDYTNGLNVARLLRATPRHIITPIVMPVSLLQASIFRMRLKEVEEDTRLFVIEEKELDDSPSLLERLQRFLNLKRG